MARVLLVEDDADLRDALHDALVDAGYVVDCAINGKEALDALEVGPKPSVIVLDLMMPDMDGWQFRHAMSLDPDHADIPIIVVSAHGGDAPCDANAYLRKPIDRAVLIRAVYALSK